MTWFRSFRADHGFPFYGDQPSPESLDKQLVAVVYVCVLLSGATLIATLGIRGREKWSHAVRASYAVAIASSILLCLMSHNWMEGSVKVKAPFVYRSNMHFSGRLSVQIGLKSANITLDGVYMSPTGGKNVYYVETLPWPQYGSERKCYQHQLQRGLPGPVLRVMDFLTYPHGELQWGKSYHTAGQYAWALLWTSFVFWILANLLLFSVVVYGAYMFFLSGVALLMACVAYSQTLNPQPLHMTFGRDVLELEYGWSFWLAVVAGCLTTVLGILLIVTDYFLHTKVAEFFHLEKMGDEEDFSIKDDHPLSSKPRFYTDARGSLASTVHGDGSRRGSIFLEPSRQTNKWAVNPFGGPQTRGSLFGSSQSHGLHNGFDSKLNPLYNEGADGSSNEDMTTRSDNQSPRRLNTRSKSESFISSAPASASAAGTTVPETVRQQQQQQQHGINKRLCGSRQSIRSDRKPSLATLKEHRENHVNEQRSNSSQCCYLNSNSNSNSGNFSSRSVSTSGHVPPTISQSLNDVNVAACPSGSAHAQNFGLYCQKQNPVDGRFYDEGTDRRFSAPIGLGSGDVTSRGGCHGDSGNGGVVGSGGGNNNNSRSGDTVVEVVVESHHRDGDDEDEGAMKKAAGVSYDYNNDGYDDENDDDIELQKMEGGGSGGSGGCGGCGSSPSSVGDDTVFDESYARRHSTRHAPSSSSSLPGGARQEVTSSQVVDGSESGKRKDDDDNNNDDKMNKRTSMRVGESDRHVSISMGAI